jgi:phosphate uptake regulator
MAEKFHTELKAVKNDTVEMAQFGRMMLRDAVDALIRQDKELAVEVVARKEQIHSMEVKL